MRAVFRDRLGKPIEEIPEGIAEHCGGRPSVGET